MDADADVEYLNGLAFILTGLEALVLAVLLSWSGVRAATRIDALVFELAARVVVVLERDDDDEVDSIESMRLRTAVDDWLIPVDGVV
jgi:hypothetical protein